MRSSVAFWGRVGYALALDVSKADLLAAHSFGDGVRLDALQGRDGYDMHGFQRIAFGGNVAGLRLGSKRAVRRDAGSRLQAPSAAGAVTTLFRRRRATR